MGIMLSLCSRKRREKAPEVPMPTPEEGIDAEIDELMRRFDEMQSRTR